MGWVSHDLKVPDETAWVALVEVTPDGETEILGYIDRNVFQALVEANRELVRLWDGYLGSGLP